MALNPFPHVTAKFHHAHMGYEWSYSIESSAFLCVVVSTGQERLFVRGVQDQAATTFERQPYCA